MLKEEFKDSKGVIRIRKSKYIQRKKNNIITKHYT